MQRQGPRRRRRPRQPRAAIAAILTRDPVATTVHARAVFVISTPCAARLANHGTIFAPRRRTTTAPTTVHAVRRQTPRRLRAAIAARCTLGRAATQRRVRRVSAAWTHCAAVWCGTSSAYRADRRSASIVARARPCRRKPRNRRRHPVAIVVLPTMEAAATMIRVRRASAISTRTAVRCSGIRAACRKRPRTAPPAVRVMRRVTAARCTKASGASTTAARPASATPTTSAVRTDGTNRASTWPVRSAPVVAAARSPAIAVLRTTGSAAARRPAKIVCARVTPRAATSSGINSASTAPTPSVRQTAHVTSLTVAAGTAASVVTSSGASSVCAGRTNRAVPRSGMTSARKRH